MHVMDGDGDGERAERLTWQERLDLARRIVDMQMTSAQLMAALVDAWEADGSPPPALRLLGVPVPAVLPAELPPP